MSSIAEISERRYTCKAYDPKKKISKELIEQLYTVLRNSPSSVNSQPWHFMIAETDEAKAQILPAIMDFNQPRVQNASHVVLFLAKNELSSDFLAEIVDQEEKDLRFPEEGMKEANDKGRRYFVGLNDHTPEDLHIWQDKQIYIALGNLLFAAAALDIDSTPIEGFHPDKLDEILDLKNKGYRSVVVASLGYHSNEDFNVTLKKSRLPINEVLTVF
ncbi:oxygen-insensitive NAD(P)H nitroreductase [Ignatzschineria sp. LJL83]